jgi:alpha-tubulin suppressor-like RCC1 family protein
MTSAIAVSAGGGSTCAIRTDRTVWCWGGNGFGQLGDGTRKERHKPVRVKDLSNVTAISATGGHSCAIRADGSAWCWGHNFYGELGSWARRNTFGEPDRLEPVRVEDLGGIRAISGGYDHTCALRSGGRVWCFGPSGQVGGSEDKGWSPARGRVIGLTDAIAIDAGGYHTCAVTAEETVRCWGSNDSRQLGYGERFTPTRGRPVEVAGLRDVTAVTAGGKHTCAVTRDGEAWCWGNDSYGQVGDGDGRNGRTPVRVRIPTMP